MTIRHGARVGAAAFALGLALAGPAWVAAADAGNADATVSAGSGDARAGAQRAARAPSDSRPARVAPRTDSAVGAPAAAARRVGGSSPQRVATDRGGAEARDLADRAAVRDRPRGSVALRSTPVDRVERTNAVASGSAAASSAAAQVPSINHHIPTGTDLEGATDSGESLGTTGPADVQETIAGLRSAVVRFFDSVSRLLSSLPANPLGDFVSGALFLVRRTLLNDRPIAQPVTFGITASGAVEGSVAIDLEGDPLTAALIDGPDYGTVQIDPGGAFAYLPGPDYTGFDSFTVSISDSGFNLFDPLGGRSVEVTVPIGAPTGVGAATDKCSYGAKGCVLYPGEGLSFGSPYQGQRFQIVNMTNYRVQVADYVPQQGQFSVRDGQVTLVPFAVNGIADKAYRAPWYVVLNTSKKYGGSTDYATATCTTGNAGGCYYPDPTWRTDAFASIAVLLDYGCTRENGCYNTLGEEYDFDPNGPLRWGDSTNPITGADLRRIYDAMTAYNTNVFDRNCNNWGCNSYDNKLASAFENIRASVAQLQMAANKPEDQSMAAESINNSGQSLNNVSFTWKAEARPQPVPDSPWWKKIGRFATDNILTPLLTKAGVPEKIAGAIKEQLGLAFAASDVTATKTFQDTTASLGQILLPYSLNRVIVTAPNSISATGDLVFTLPKCVKSERACPNQVPSSGSSDPFLAAWRIHDLEYVMPNKYDYSFAAQFEAKPYQAISSDGTKQKNVGFTMASATQTVNGVPTSSPAYQVGMTDQLMLKAFVGAGATAKDGEEFSQRGCSGTASIDCTTFRVSVKEGQPGGVEVTVGEDGRATLTAKQPGVYVVEARYDWQLLRPLSNNGQNKDGTDGWYRDYVLATMEVRVN